MRDRAILPQLDALLPRFGAEAAASKLALLAALERGRLARIHRAADLQALQRVICFLRAFPDDARVHRAALRLAAGFAARVARLPRRERARLDDSGMAGTTTRNVYGCAAARWLAARFAAQVDVDWPSYETPEALAPLLQPLLDPLEDEYTQFDAGGLRDWIGRARAGREASDLRWLLAQSPPAGAAAQAFAREYDAAAVPLAWRLEDSRAAITRNALAQRPAFRADGLRRPEADSRAAITRPLEAVALLPRRAAARLLEVWRAALWSRTRTVFQIEQPNLDECWLCDLGCGLQMAAIGVRPELRGTLEVTYGHLLLANGTPIGYGGFTSLFRQVNTGINVFPQYRGSEAAFAWQQALRAMHTLTGCAHFIVNPYQFGAGNDEALASGAFWFYHRLGFRPVQPAVRRLAERELARLRADRAYRVPKATLRELAACDLRLDLTDRGDTLFDEAWLAPLAAGITAAIAREPAVDRATALKQLTRRVAAQAGIDPAGWSAPERAALAQFAPLLAQVDDLARWAAPDKAALAALIRARRAPVERDFVARLREHDRLRTALAQAAAGAQGQRSTTIDAADAGFGRSRPRQRRAAVRGAG